MPPRQPPGPPKPCPRCGRLVSWASKNPRPHRCEHGVQCRSLLSVAGFVAECPRCEAGENVGTPDDACARADCGHARRRHDHHGACVQCSCVLFVPPGARKVAS